ncbi:MAG: hypothetical protein ABI343_14965 [Burkholderiaceae bacterium]
MRRQLLFAAISCCVVGVQSQPVSGDPTFDRQAARQRREDLRKAWESNRSTETTGTKDYDTAPPMRHLSQQELAEMREQLRRQPPVQQLKVPAPSR